MMDNGQPSKRPRTEGPPGQFSRELPQPLPTPSAPQYQQHGPTFARPPEHQSNPLDAHRRHSAHTEHQHYDSDPRRSSCGPSHVYHHPGTQPPQQPPPYGGPREGMLKREPGDDAAPLHYRPASTGSAPDHNLTPTHGEGRYPNLPPPSTFEHQPMPQNSGPQPFRPPYGHPQSPMTGNEPYGHHAFGTSGLPLRQDPYPGLSYPSSVANTQKRKAQRAAQACDSCRTLKAKCDEGRPTCLSCRDKGIACVYRDPPPKQQDRTTTEIMEGINDIKSSMAETVQTVMENEMRKLRNELSHRLERVEGAVFSNTVPSDERLKDEVDVKPASGFHSASMPAPELPSLQRSAPSLAPSAMAFDAHAHPADETPYPPHPGQQHVSQALLDLVESVEEDDDGDPVNPGQSSIPVNHTTGAARLLLVRPISELAHGIIKIDKIKNEKYPMLQEERRGLLRLYGRGEGTERLPGYDKDPLTDSGPEGTTPTASDTSSDVGSPAEDWGQLGGLTPPGEPLQRGHINSEGMPDLSEGLVRKLVASYMEHINILHPILVPRKLNHLVDHFLKTIPDPSPKSKQVVQVQTGHSAGFVSSQRNSESPGNKRKRSPGGDGYEGQTIQDLKPGHPFRSIGSAIVLLVMALGEICQRTTKIPDCTFSPGSDISWSSPTMRNGHPPSPSQSSPAMSSFSSIPSPLDGDKPQSGGQRTSMEVPYQTKDTLRARPKNLDTIPGLRYFAFATDIIGNQAGGNSLQHVHANILASLYHGQLGRPLESHAYLHQACRSLQVILRPKLDRFKKHKQGVPPETPPSVVPAKDNALIFAFWTCLQLESDIVAELPVPHSGILTYEEDMPDPNLVAAADVDELDPLVIESYAAQLYLRKHLNQLHNMFYKPENDSEFPSIFSSPRPLQFRTIDASLENLENIHQVAPHMRWREEDLPAADILRARLRAKYYGAKVITYRHFLLKILEHSYAQRSAENPAAQRTDSTSDQFSEEFSEPFKHAVKDVPRVNADTTYIEDARIYDYAGKCIQALIKSTTAFHGMGDPGRARLIVTNIWGTAHAQWGNLLTLQAASVDPILKSLIPWSTLQDLYDKTMAFLRLAAQPSSALHIDYKILEHVGNKIGLISRQLQAGTSFSSTTTGGDVQMTGH